MKCLILREKKLYSKLDKKQSAILFLWKATHAVIS